GEDAGASGESPARPPARGSRPRHRRTSRRGPSMGRLSMGGLSMGGTSGSGTTGTGASQGGRGGRRRMSLLVAAPAFITVAVVGSTLLGTVGGESQRARSGTPSSVNDRVPPPEPGWYTVTTAGGPPQLCLSILYDDRQRWQLAADKCVAGDQYQRIELAPVQAGVYRLKAQTPQGKVWCAAVDGQADGSVLLMKTCGDDPLQRFGLQAAKQVKSGQVWRVVPEATARGRMCVGVDLRGSGGYETKHVGCARAGIDGFVFTAAPIPQSP
uniref:hypothetical protein n=1 Tax=Actinomadura roseirufa TaxID=2094049 RepID=UPI001A955887